MIVAERDESATPADNVIDLATERFALERGVSVRRRPEAVGCAHTHMNVDDTMRAVECRVCHVELDPIDALVRLAKGPDEVARAKRMRDDLQEQAAKIRTDIERLRGQRTRDKEGQPPVYAEIEKSLSDLRTYIEVLAELAREDQASTVRHTKFHALMRIEQVIDTISEPRTAPTPTAKGKKKR